MTIRTVISFASYVLLLTFCGSNVVAAGTVFYTNQSIFESVAVNVVKESFETPFADAPIVTFDGFTVFESSTNPLIKSRTDYVSDGTRSMGFTWNGNGSFTMMFDAPITKFGVNILDFGTLAASAEFRVSDDSGQISNQLVAVGDASATRGVAQFFGVMTDNPFVELEFASNQTVDNDLIVFDEVIFSSSAVPEPSSIVVIALGCVTGLIRRRKLG